jgi:hypothetical protein
MLALEGNESHQVVLYETESLMLQLSSALDLLAKIVNRLFSVNIKKYDVGWTKTKFCKALREAWPELPKDVLSLVTTTAQLLGLIRNRSHHGPPAPVAGDDMVWFALASEDQATFELRARDLGGAAAWGIVENRGLQGRLIDPWKLAEQATLATHHALRTVAKLSVGRFSSTTVEPKVWPRDPYTAEVVMLYLGLAPAG